MTDNLLLKARLITNATRQPAIPSLRRLCQVLGCLLVASACPGLLWFAADAQTSTQKRTMYDADGRRVMEYSYTTALAGTDCSVPADIAELFPVETPFYKNLFAEACDEHDYGWSHAPWQKAGFAGLLGKQISDERFLANMLRACDTHWPTGPFGIPSDQQIACHIAARVWYEAVALKVDERWQTKQNAFTRDNTKKILYSSVPFNAPVPPTVALSPTKITLYEGESVSLFVTAGGVGPLAFRWQFNNKDIPGATRGRFDLNQLQVSDSGVYRVILTAANGDASATMTLTVLPPPPARTQILAKGPIGYWPLDERTGTAIADAAGTFDGKASAGVSLGAPSSSMKPFIGLGTGNSFARFSGTNSTINLPPLNVRTTNFTMTGWVRLKSGSPQAAWSGILFGRIGGRGTGMMIANHKGNVELRYSWNDDGRDWGWSTGLKLPSDGAWAFVALTVDPKRAVLYLGSGSGMESATNNQAQTGQFLNSGFSLGSDPGHSDRLFKGDLDEIALYNRTLSPREVAEILDSQRRLASMNILWKQVGNSGEVEIGFVAASGLEFLATVWSGRPDFGMDPHSNWRPIGIVPEWPPGSGRYLRRIGASMSNAFYRVRTE